MLMFVMIVLMLINNHDQIVIFMDCNFFIIIIMNLIIIIIIDRIITLHSSYLNNYLAILRDSNISFCCIDHLYYIIYIITLLL